MGAEAVGIGDVRRLDIALDHRFLELRRDVAPRVLEQRDEIVGRVAGERVLEIEQAEIDAIGQHHQIVGMIIAQDQDGIALDDGQNVAPGLSPGAKIVVLVDFQPQRRRVPFGEAGRPRGSSPHRHRAAGPSAPAARRSGRGCRRRPRRSRVRAPARAAAVDRPGRRRNPRAAAAPCGGRPPAGAAARSRGRAGVRRRSGRGRDPRAPAARPSAPPSCRRRHGRGNSGGSSHRRPADGSRHPPSRARPGKRARPRAESSGRPSASPSGRHLGCQGTRAASRRRAG